MRNLSVQEYSKGFISTFMMLVSLWVFIHSVSAQVPGFGLFKEVGNTNNEGANSLKGNDWTLKGPHGWLSGRYGHAMAYIGAGKLLLFGGHAGGNLDDTWIYDLSSDFWTPKNPSPRPYFRFHHAMAYIGGDQVLLFGGYNTQVDFNDETWVYDLSSNTWTQRNPSSKPSARFGHKIVYIGGDRVLLFGGSHGGSNLDNDTWIYDLSENTWTNKNPATKPQIRQHHAMAYIGEDQVVVFGGSTNLGLNNWGDTWVYDLSDNTWTEKKPSSTPITRFGHAMAYLGGDQVVMFGGYGPHMGNLGAPIGDTWVYDLSDNIWTQDDNNSSSPSPRYWHTLCESSLDGSSNVVLFSGAYQLVPSYDLSIETWTFGGGGGAVPDISSNPRSWDFGSVLVGNSAHKIFVIKNVGTATLNVTSTAITGANAAEFSISVGGGAFNLAPDATRNVIIRFFPTSEGSKTAWLGIRSNDPNEDPFLVRLTGVGGASSFTWQVSSGWNIISVPLFAADMSVSSLFPDAASQAFGFNNGYQAATTLKNGVGYWIKFTSAKSYRISGTPVTPKECPVSTGWNIVGPFESDVPVSAITTVPADIVVSNYFGYDNGYAKATMLTVGKGYWVKVGQAGTLRLPNGSAMAKMRGGSLSPNEGVEASWPRLIVQDKDGHVGTLYLVTDKNIGSRFELPPPPPAGIFDVRFSSGQYAESLNGGRCEIQVSSAQYPIRLKAESFQDRLLNVKDGLGGNILNDRLKEGKTIVIAEALDKIVLEESQLPIRYSLSQNQPNPFNPTTVIKFSLPERAHVKLTVYNVLGEKVAELVNRELAAGHHQVTFDAQGYATGVYLYVMESGGFRNLKKMVVVK